MGLVWEYLTFAGKSSEDFSCHISGSGTYVSPTREVESVSIPGRNGDLHIDFGKFKNVEIKYPAFITENFEQNYSALKAFLLSKTGYERLTDSYHPDHFRLAVYSGDIAPTMSARNRAGSFELTFDCDPRMFLKEAVFPVAMDAAGQIFNKTLFASRPLIRAYGTGTLTIGGVTIEITNADGYTDIDCELQEAFKGDVNCNTNIILADGVFPELAPGYIDISFSGITRLEVTPRFWTI